MKPWMTLVSVEIAFVMLPTLALADSITFTAPTFEVSNTAGTTSFDVTVTTDGSYDVSSYGIQLALQGQNGATGLTITGMEPAPSNYFFSSNANFYYNSGDNYAEDYVASTEPEADIAKNTVEVNLAIAPDTLGVFDVNFVTNLGQTSLTDINGDPFPNEVYTSGVITVVPEPTTLGLLVIGTMGLLARRGRRPAETCR